MNDWWNGDAAPEWGTCLTCGAGPAEDCAPGCGCESCEADQAQETEIAALKAKRQRNAA